MAASMWTQMSQLAAQARLEPDPAKRAQLYIDAGYQWTGSSWSRTTGISPQTLQAAVGLVPVAGPAFQQLQSAVTNVQGTKTTAATGPVALGPASPVFSSEPAVSKAGFSPIVAIVLVGVLVGFVLMGRR